MRFVVEAEQDGMMLLRLLALKAPEMPPWALRDALRRRDVRIDGELTKEKIKLDDTRKESMDRLIEGGERIYEANKDRLSAFLDRLASRTVLDSVRLTRPRSLPQA